MKKTINVLQFICPTGFYGAERWILALAKHLPQSEVRCDLAVTLEDNNQDLELCKHYQSLGLKTHEVFMRHKFDIAAIYRLGKLIEEQQIDIIHTHGYKSDLIGVLAARKAGIPCIVTPHGFENANDLKLRLFIWLGCQAMRFANKVVPLSQQLLKDCRQAGVKESKLLYIQNGVDLSEVENTPCPIKNPGDRKRIGFIGQMISRKNIYDLLDIFDAVHKNHPETELVLLGDGDQRNDLESYARSLASTNHIKFMGFRNDRLELLKSFDLFAMTSTLEGIPRCLMEAIAAEIPVAAYDIPGIDQLISHEKTGLLAPPGNREKLQQHWESLLYEPEKAQKLTLAARTFIYENYSAQRMAAEYSQLFRQLTQNSKGRSA